MHQVTMTDEQKKIIIIFDECFSTNFANLPEERYQQLGAELAKILEEE